MNRHCKTITRTPIAAQTTPSLKMDAIISIVTDVVTTLQESFVPFVSSTIDAIVMMMRSMPWFT